MTKLSKDQIKQEVYDLYDEYVHNKIDRRKFMERITVYAVGGITVSSLLSAMLPDYETTRTIKEEDTRLKSGYINYDSPKGGDSIKGLLSTPEGVSGKVGGVVVVHENRGLNPYIEDVGRRAAVAGFVSLAPDALTPLGGYPGNDDEGRTMQRKRDRNEMLEDFIAAYEYLKNHPDCNGKVGVVGFCFGGWISNMMAVRLPELAASVPFYGSQPSAEDTAKIKAPLMLQYAGLDKRVNAGWPAYEEALKANKIEHQAFVYPDVNHGFHNNTTSRFDEASAKLAEDRTFQFFNEKLT